MSLALVPRSARALAEHLNTIYRVLRGVDPDSVTLRLSAGGSFEVRHSVTAAPVLRVTDAGAVLTGGVSVPASTITSAMIVDGTIVGADIAPATITSDKLVTGAPITPGSITGFEIADGTLLTADLEPNAVTQRLASGVFTGSRGSGAMADVDSVNGKVSLTSTGGDWLILFSGYASNSSANQGQTVGLRLDATDLPLPLPTYSFPGSATFPIPFASIALLPAVAAGSHVVAARHQTGGGTMSTAGQLVAIEFKR